MIVCVAVQFIDAPGASDEPFGGSTREPLTLRVNHRHAVNVMLPSLVATIVYVIT